MRLSPILSLAALSLAACVSTYSTPPAATTQVVVQQPQPVVTPVAPTPPPPPQPELVPPPPVSASPIVWQPGHWRYSGIGTSPWSWQSGQYVSVPPGATAWVPGQWQQLNGGFVWREGHWA